MPLVNGKLISADDAIAQDRCPETGRDLRKVNPIAQRNQLWQTTPPPDKRGDEARHRMALYDDFITKNKVRTSNMPPPKKEAAPVEVKKTAAPVTNEPATV